MQITVDNLRKEYGAGESKVVALNSVNMDIESHDFIFITGPSGSGKSTLFHITSGLDTPTGGSATYDAISTDCWIDKKCPQHKAAGTFASKCNFRYE